MGTSTGSGGAGAPAQLGGVFGAKASPYLGAVLKGITSGANFQQAPQTPNYLSGGFNPQGYLSRYPDVAAAVQSGQVPSAMSHYMNWGMNEGRAPNAWATGGGPNYLGSTLRGRFNEGEYLKAYPDVAGAVQSGAVPSALYHYLNFGRGEGRSPYGWGPTAGAQSQWMPPRTAPPGMTPTSSLPGVQYTQQPVGVPPAPVTTPATAAPGGTAATPATGQGLVWPGQELFDYSSG